jgi:hypothetical protein
MLSAARRRLGDRLAATLLAPGAPALHRGLATSAAAAAAPVKADIATPAQRKVV